MVSLDNVIFPDGIFTSDEDCHALVEVYLHEGVTAAELRRAVTEKLYAIYTAQDEKNRKDIEEGLYADQDDMKERMPLYGEEDEDGLLRVYNAPVEFVVWFKVLAAVIGEEIGF